VADLEGVLWHWLSDNWCGLDGPPLDHKWYAVEEPGPKGRGTPHVIGLTDDAACVSLGTPQTWAYSLHRAVWNKLVLWYLIQWGVLELFGLRRWLWYKLLSRRVKQNKQFGENYRYEQLLQDVRAERRAR
jgi:hypothetical protein